MESKGTRSETSSAFDKTVDDGYIGQVDPHLGHAIGTSAATHGYCIGAWMTSPTKADVNIHHTELVHVVPSTGPGARPGSITSVQQSNYATAFRLAHSQRLADQVSAGRIVDEDVPFVEFEWLGHRWLTLGTLGRYGFHSNTPFGKLVSEIVRNDPHRDYWSLVARYGEFAVERHRALEVLRVLSRSEGVPERAFDLTPMPADTVGIAKTATRGAIFPDGLAVLPLPDSVRPVVWERRLANLSYY